MLTTFAKHSDKLILKTMALFNRNKIGRPVVAPPVVGYVHFENTSIYVFNSVIPHTSG